MEKLLNIGQKYYNASLKVQSPIIEDVQRIVNHDEKGNEFVSFVPIDYSEIMAKNGIFANWSLNSLLAAGVNPNFSISTGYGTRLQGVSDLNNAVVDVDAVLSSIEDMPE